jgi:hypothetical protein
MFTAKYFTLFLLLTVLCQISMAQFQTVPLRNTEISKKSSARTTALSLPFFDDFSTSNVKTDPSKWLKNGGVFVNNDATLSNPTLNVATFDGLKANGTPYDFSNSFANGATDSLTSQPINLQNYTARDSVYLSFFYQSKGLGEVSDANDSLMVQFLTNGDKWETAFVAKDGKHIIGKDTIKIINNTQFIQILLPINATKYLHDKFQFRFRTFGRQSGQFDVWHIDYVYLNDKRNPRDIFYSDVAFKNPVSSILSNYTSMPMTQFLANPTNELSKVIKSNIFYLFSNRTNVGVEYSIQDLKTGNFLIQKSLPVSQLVGSVSTADIEVQNELGNSVKGDKALLKVKFKLISTDVGVFQANDTISRTVELDNYYAYDDGTAESGAYLKDGFGRVAVRFVNNKPDVVKAIRINLQSVLDSTRLTTTNLSLQVMANDRGKPGRILRGFSGKIIYPSTNNGFVEYAIEPVAVTDTFYVGYTQLSDDKALVVGLDNNAPEKFIKNHFYNITNAWTNVGDVPKNSGFNPIQGSLMIRPVMGGVAKNITLSTEEEIQNRNLVISPNPTFDIIRWNDASLKNAEIIEMTGRSVLLQKADNQEINISNLNSGTYILRLSNEKNTFVRKIVKL